MKRLGLAFLFALACASTASALLWIQPSRFSVSGGATPALIANTAAALGASGGTTGSVNTTGANLIVVNVAFYDTSGSVTDSKGNTYTALTAVSDQSGLPVKSQLWYCYGATVGTGHTFSSTALYSSIQVAAFSNAASSPFDVENGTGATTSWTSLATGSLTPSQANTIIVAGVAIDGSGVTIGIDNSLTITDTVAFAGGTNEGGSLAYKVLTSASAINPTWSSSPSANRGAAVAATFKY